MIALVGVVLLGATATLAQPPLAVNVSGYEFFPGVPCTLDTEPTTCGVTFGGWTGGAGAVAGGWVPFPGNRLGFWKAKIDRQGTAAFGSAVTIVGGTWRLALRQGITFIVLSGIMTGGTVQWPTPGGNLTCGTNVARVTANLLVTELGSTPATFNGCLHDLPIGTILPPEIWGTIAIY
jgi:hypothetical protein